jgi:hypothetical protein
MFRVLAQKSGQVTRPVVVKGSEVRIRVGSLSGMQSASNQRIFSKEEEIIAIDLI